MKVNGDRIRERRDELDWSPDDLAERMKLKPGSLRNILNGSDPASRRVVYRFARVLALPLSEILAATYPDEPPKQPDRPKAPPRRQEKEQTTAPKRAQERVA